MLDIVKLAEQSGAKVVREVRTNHAPVIAVEFLPGDFAAFSRALLEEAAKVCDEQATEPECPERAQYCAEAIRAMLPAPSKEQEKMRYNYTRYRGTREMAEGIAVHASSKEEADTKADEMLRSHYSSADRLVFRDNNPCVINCTICRAPNNKEVKDDRP